MCVCVCVLFKLFVHERVSECVCEVVKEVCTLVCGLNSSHTHYNTSDR